MLATGLESCVHVAPDIIIGTESKLDNTYKNCKISPQGYQTNVIRRDRNSHGGGVFIIAKDEINIPLVVAKIMLKDEADITVGAFYRQPNSTVTEIDDLMTTLLSIQNRHRTTEFIIGGDFNLPGIMWGDSVNIKDTPSYGNAWNKILLSMLLMLFTFIFTILRAFPGLLFKSSLTVVVEESASLKSCSGDVGYGSSARGRVHLGQKNVNEPCSIRVPYSSSEMFTHPV